MLNVSSMDIERQEDFGEQRQDRKKHRMITAMMARKSRSAGKIEDTLGRRVRDLRQAYDWGQEEMAARMEKITGTRVGQAIFRT